MAELLLKPGGRLVKTEWFYPSRQAKQAQEREVLEDVTETAPLYLMEPVDLDENLTLLDFFKLLRENELLQAIWHRDFAEDYVKAAFKLETVPLVGQQGGSAVEYLELYQRWEKDHKTKEFNVYRMNLHGVGPLLSEDLFEDGHLIGRAGTRVQYSISFRPVKELLSLPLRYNPEVEILEHNIGSKRKRETKREKVFVYSPTLCQIIQGVMYELSCHGAPEDSAETFDELKGMVAEIKSELAAKSPPEPEESQ